MNPTQPQYKKIGIIGTGNIGAHLKQRLEAAGHSVCFFWNNKDLSTFQKMLAGEWPDAVFLAISTLDDGLAARDYILTCVTQSEHGRRNIPVITCEKGAHAYFPQEMREHHCLIGSTATVGGGTMMLGYMQQRARVAHRSVEIEAVLNGTLNFVFDSAARNGRTLGEACSEAIRLGYAEPNATDPVSLVNGELKDVMMKTCIFFNRNLSAKSLLTPSAFDLKPFTATDIESLTARPVPQRLVVSFTKRDGVDGTSALTGPLVEAAADGWKIAVAFRDVPPGSPRALWLPAGAGNALHIVEGNEFGDGGQYTLTGPGAGDKPTTTAMLADFERLLG